MNYKAAAFIFCIFVFNLEQNQAQLCSYEHNTNFYGNDIAYVYASCASSCCSRCYAQPGCTGWTYVEGFYNCWLKNFTTSNINRVSCSGRTSGLVQSMAQPVQPIDTPCQTNLPMSTTTPCTTTTTPYTTTTTTTPCTTTTTTTPCTTTTTTTPCTTTTTTPCYTPCDPCNLYNPCQNGGQCYNSSCIPACFCPPTYYGTFCEHTITTTTTPCTTTTTTTPCTTTTTTTPCTTTTTTTPCTTTTTTTPCITTTTTPCYTPCDPCNLYNPCQNGGQCYNSSCIPACYCSPSYYGAFCEHTVTTTTTPCTTTTTPCTTTTTPCTTTTSPCTTTTSPCTTTTTPCTTTTTPCTTTTTPCTTTTSPCTTTTSPCTTTTTPCTTTTTTTPCTTTTTTTPCTTTTTTTPCPPAVTTTPFYNIQLTVPNNGPLQCSQVELNTDFYGNDIPKILYAQNAASCCNLCSSTQGCTGYTYCCYSQRCLLKSFVTPNRVAAFGRTSGIVVSNSPAIMPQSGCSAFSSFEQNTIYHGFDLANIYANVPSSCCSICSARAGCNGFTYSLNEKRCLLKNITSSLKTLKRVYSPGHVSSFINKQNDVVVAATTTPVTQSVIYSSDTCPLIETNVDYKGNDTDYKFSTSVESCCSICSNTEGCTGFTYISSAHVCWLKSFTTPIRVASPGRTSGSVAAVKKRNH